MYILTTFLILAVLSLSLSLVFSILRIIAGIKNGVHTSRDIPRIFMEKAARMNERILPKRYKGYVRVKIREAFGHNSLDENTFIFIQECLSFVLFVLLALDGIINRRLSAVPFWLSLGVGILLPLLYLKRRIRVRKEKTVESIPYFADMLTLSCEAGLDIFAALINIAKSGFKGPMGNIIEDILKDIKIGKSRQEALKCAYKKTDIWDLKSILMTIIQAESLGTPIGESLRNQAEIMRQERLNRAEKLAQEAPIKLLVPLLFFIFPVTFVILLSPILMRFMDGSLF